mgnify:CR=1 FL=1
MSVDTDSVEGHIIRQLIPLSTIPTDQFAMICNQITVEEATPNTYLFKKNDTENKLVYLINGSIRLQSDNLIVEQISSGSESSRFALAHQIPRKIDALTQSTVRFIRLESNTLDSLPNPTHQQEENSFMANDEPEEEENDDDWMTTLLKSPIFRALPPANLQQLVMSLEEIKYDKGDTIIKQGDPGDYYYLVKKGYCLISRKASEHAKEIKLAQLRSQDTFGEDSLLSGEPRNVTITAQTKVSLIRLSKEKFISLIKEPSLKFIKHDLIQDELANGAMLIDVRAPDDYKKRHLPQSHNMPFFSLRIQLNTIDKSKPVIVVCENGKTSEAAAFLLLRNTIQALILEGGMESVPAEEIKPEAAFPIDDGIETLSANSENIESDDLTAQDSSEIRSDSTLLIENQQLKQSMQSLQAEKDNLEKKYRMLYKQTEKLKSILDTLKK